MTGKGLYRAALMGVLVLVGYSDSYILAHSPVLTGLSGVAPAARPATAHASGEQTNCRGADPHPKACDKSQALAASPGSLWRVLAILAVFALSRFLF